MKLIVIGRGHKVQDIASSLSTKRRNIIAITDEENLYQELKAQDIRSHLLSLNKLNLSNLAIATDIEDIIIVTLYEKEILQDVLANLVEKQQVKSPVTVFTSLDIDDLRNKYPTVHFKHDDMLYRGGLRDVMLASTTRHKFNELKKIAYKAKKLVVVIWGNPDPDAIASAYALKTLLKRDDSSYLITYTGEFTRSENIAMVQSLNIKTQKFTNSLINAETVVVTLDAQPSFFTDNNIKFDIVIDHHPKSSCVNAGFSDIRTSYGSTSTILTEYFIDLSEKMPKAVATALYYGLKTDTNNLQRIVSDADINAFKYLRKRADENIIRRIELSQLPQSTLDHFSTALAKKRIFGDVIFAYLGRVDNPDACVHVADFFIKVDDISWAICSAISHKKLVVVFRCDGFKKDAGKTAETLFAEFGSAGGHRVMARAEIDLDKLRTQLKGKSDEEVEKWLIHRLSSKFNPLLSK